MRGSRGECILVTLAVVGCMFVVVALLGVAGYVYYRKMSQPQVRPMPHQTPTRQVTLSRGTDPDQPSSVRVTRTSPHPPPPEVESPTPRPTPPLDPPAAVTPPLDPPALVTPPVDPPAPVTPKPGVNPPSTLGTPIPRTALESPVSSHLEPEMPTDPAIRAEGLSLGLSFSELQKSRGKLTKAVRPSRNPWKAQEFLPPGGSPKLYFVEARLVAIEDAQSLEFQGQSLRRGDPVELAALRNLFVTRLETQKSELAGGVRHNFPIGSLEVQVWVDQGHCRQLTLARRLRRKSPH